MLNLKNKKLEKHKIILGLFKNIIYIILITVLLITISSCGKLKQGNLTVDTSAVETTTPETTVATTTPETTAVETTTPETTGPIEYEGVVINPIEGLRFDKGTFYFLKGNEYGGETGIEAGVCIPDGPEINGQTTWFGFKKEVVEMMQKKIMEEKKEFTYAFPIDLELAKGIKIKEIASTWVDKVFKSDGRFWDNNAFLAVSNVPIGTIIYPPVSTPEYLIWDNNCGRNNPSEPNWYSLNFGVIVPGINKEVLLFKNEKVDVAILNIGAKGINLLPPGFEKNIVENKDEGYSFLTVAKIEEPIAEVVSEEYLPFSSAEEPNDSNVRLITLSFSIRQLKDKNSKVELYHIPLLDFSKISSFGLKVLLKIENIPVFIKPVL